MLLTKRLADLYHVANDQDGRVLGYRSQIGNAQRARDASEFPEAWSGERRLRKSGSHVDDQRHCSPVHHTCAVAKLAWYHQREGRSSCVTGQSRGTDHFQVCPHQRKIEGLYLRVSVASMHRGGRLRR